MKRALILSIVLGISSGLFYAAHERDRVQTIVGSSWSKQSGDFGAMLLLSNEPDQFIKAWQETTKEFPLQMTDTVSRGIPIVAFILFRGCKADERGLCNASVDFTVLRPDGTEYASFTDKDLWKNKPAMPNGAVQLSAEHMGVVIEPEDPLGRYEIHVLVRDLNAGVTLKLSKKFTATRSHG